jgi:hypothetical protein
MLSPIMLLPLVMALKKLRENGVRAQTKEIEKCGRLTPNM